MKLMFWSLMILLAPLAATASDLEKLLQTGTCQGCDLRGVDLSHRTLTLQSLYDSRLDGANLSHSRLNFHNVHNNDFTNVDLTGAELNVSDGLHGNRFIGTKLDDAKLRVGRCYHSQFQGVQMRRAIFHSGSVTRYCNFDASILDGADLRAWFYSQTFMGTSLKGARIYLGRGTTHSQARFLGADLSQAEVRATSFADVEFGSTKLEGATLNGMLCHPGSLGSCLDSAGNPRPLP